MPLACLNPLTANFSSIYLQAGLDLAQIPNFNFLGEVEEAVSMWYAILARMWRRLSADVEEAIC